jgi:AcrR family transcriptional regulator
MTRHELCARAGFSKTTFYRRYRGDDGLMGTLDLCVEQTETGVGEQLTFDRTAAEEWLAERGRRRLMPGERSSMARRFGSAPNPKLSPKSSPRLTRDAAHDAAPDGTSCATE